jgi:hypothetical protein
LPTAMNKIQTLACSVRGVIIGFLALAIICSLAWGWQHLRSERHRLALLLHTQLPSSAHGVRTWYRQVPGTYQAELIARMELPRSEFDLLVQRMGLHNANQTGEGWDLPTRFNTDASVTWWNPPDNQVNRYYLSTNGYQVTCIWHEGTVYILKQGGFGSPWR